MRGDGAQTNDKALCHLSIGQTCCHQSQDLHFAGGQSGGIGRETLCPESGLHGKRLACGKRLRGRHRASIRQGLGESSFSQMRTSRSPCALKEGLWNEKIEGVRKALRRSP